MINVQLPHVGRDPAATPVYRIGVPIFWLLFALEGLFIVSVLLFGLLTLPNRSPLARAGDYAVIREAIWSRLDGRIADPLVEVAPGISARESSVRGFRLGGETYYYYFEGQPGFDPLSRGTVAPNEIEVVVRDDGGPTPLVIYRLLPRRAG